MASKFIVMQDGRAVEFSFYLDNLVVRAPYSSNYFSIIGNDTNAKNGSVTIISTKEGTDIPYSITTSDSWIRQVQTGQIWLEENTGAERTGTLTITQDETGEEIVITFIQDVKPVTDYTFLFSTTETDVNNIPSPYTATPFNVYIDSYTGSTKDNTVSATHSSLPDWITGWASVDMGQGVIAYSGTTTENDTGSNRNATITFTQEGSGKIVTLHVDQEAKAMLEVPMSWDINFTNDSTTQTYPRFYLTLKDNSNNSINAFSLLNGAIESGIVQREQGTYQSQTENSFTANTCTIFSTSMKRDLYKIYCNGQLIIQTTINGDGNNHDVSLSRLLPVTGLELKFTGDVTYMD